MFFVYFYSFYLRAWHLERVTSDYVIIRRNWKRDKKSKWRLALILHLVVTKLQSSTITDRKLQTLMCGSKTLTQTKPKHLWNSRIKSLCLTWRSVGFANISRRGIMMDSFLGLCWILFCLVSLLQFLDSPTLSSYCFFLLNLKYNSYTGITTQIDVHCGLPAPTSDGRLSAHAGAPNEFLGFFWWTKQNPL